MTDRTDLAVKECELIADIVGRLSTHGHATKQLAVTVWFAAMGLGWQQRLPSLHLLAALGSGVFWWLDAFFLAAERRMRWRYGVVAATLASKPTAPIVVDPLSLDCTGAPDGLLRAAFSATTWVLYIGLMIVGLWAWRAASR